MRYPLRPKQEQPNRLRFALVGLLSLVGASLSSLYGADALADETQDYQLHFRSGYFMAQVSGAVSSSLTLPVAFDFEYEIFKSLRSSTLLTANISYDATSGRVPYNRVALGRRYYFSAIGTGVDASDGGQRVFARPRFRYFASGLMGISQLTVKTVGAALEASSTCMEISGGLGGIYQLSQSLGLEFSGGVVAGLGFTAVSVNYIGFNFLVGVTYAF